MTVSELIRMLEATGRLDEPVYMADWNEAYADPAEVGKLETLERGVVLDVLDWSRVSAPSGDDAVVFDV